MAATTATTEQAFHRCAQFLQDLHRLIAAQQEESDEAEALRAEMDPLWYAMTAEEQGRLGGLSEDLHVLAEGGAKQVVMSSEENARWTAEANKVLPLIFTGQDVNAALKFLRRPSPADRLPHIVPFLQARCWERLGEEEVSLQFMKEAERLDPRQAVCVLNILEKLGRAPEAAQYAERIIENPSSSGEELYQAAATLLQQARRMRRAEARPQLLPT